MQKLLDAAEKVTDSKLDAVALAFARVKLTKQLDRFRCTCGKIPVEDEVDGWWMVRCCGNYWDSWEDFLEWNDAKTT